MGVVWGMLADLPGDALAPGVWASTPSHAKTKKHAESRKGAGREKGCIATDKTSLLENEGNVESAFPSQLVGHYERVRMRLCYGCRVWHGMKDRG